jgi:2-polyprenyl-3-methyl-5-hydroxy-6-metoxy-1,4-benzoquinol methylase
VSRRRGFVERAVSAFADAPKGVRAHVRIRGRTCPFDELERLVPPAGHVLDVGCGHGLGSLVLALGSPTRDVFGVDIDADKIPHAVAAARQAHLGNVRFDVVTPTWRPDREYDAIVLVDVLYLLGRGPARQLLLDLCGALAPGGSIFVKEIDVEPRWKYQWARLQELAATRVARITEGEQVDFLPPLAIAEALVDAGLAVEHVPLHRRRLHPHHLVIGRRVPRA